MINVKFNISHEFFPKDENISNLHFLKILNYWIHCAPWNRKILCSLISAYVVEFDFFVNKRSFSEG